MEIKFFNSGENIGEMNTSWIKMLYFFCRLKPLDIKFMKAVDHKVNIVPVIAKADTLTKQEVIRLKQKVLLASTPPPSRALTPPTPSPSYITPLNSILL